MSFEWKDLLGGLAPTLATALGGPMAGTAVKVLSDKLLGKEEGTEAEIAKAIKTASPETLANLKKIDADFKTEMKQLDIDVFALEVQDKGSARQMAMKSMWPQVFLSGLFIFGYFTVVVCLIMGYVEIPTQHKDLVTVLLGVLTAGVANIMQFWFGSSHGSKTKKH